MLQEKAGAVCISQSANKRREQSNGHSVATGIAGPSKVTQHKGALEEGSGRGVQGDLKLLPDFFFDGYEEFPRTCKISCVVIVVVDPDDMHEFK